MSRVSEILVPLFKKSYKSDVYTYRCVCLLSMCKSVFARVIAKRLLSWAERLLGFLADNQAGFRSDWSTTSVMQMMARLQEDI